MYGNCQGSNQDFFFWHLPVYLSWSKATWNLVWKFRPVVMSFEWLESGLDFKTDVSQSEKNYKRVKERNDWLFYFSFLKFNPFLFLIHPELDLHFFMLFLKQWANFTTTLDKLWFGYGTRVPSKASDKLIPYEGLNRWNAAFPPPLQRVCPMRSHLYKGRTGEKSHNIFLIPPRVIRKVGLALWLILFCCLYSVFNSWSIILDWPKQQFIFSNWVPTSHFLLSPTPSKPFNIQNMCWKRDNRACLWTFKQNSLTFSLL